MKFQSLYHFLMIFIITLARRRETVMPLSNVSHFRHVCHLGQRSTCEDEIVRTLNQYQ